MAVELDPATVAPSIAEPATSPGEHVPFSAAAKTVLECALREALDRGHADIDVRHVLLALLRSDTGGEAAPAAARPRRRPRRAAPTHRGLAPRPVTFLIKPGEGLQAAGRGMTDCPCR